MKTALCDCLGIEVPIIQAPMGGAVGPRLVAAVSNAGGLGMLVLWRADTDTIRRQIRETRVLTSRPFGVNLNLEFPQEERQPFSTRSAPRLTPNEPWSAALMS
jgi:NAD(P)H-dependent flavin oxidoreductase YrpB (nitropropane dioxygenase family)